MSSTTLAARLRALAAVPADRCLPGRHLARLGLDLPRHQVRARELSAVLPDGHALPGGRRAAAGVDALARGAAMPTRRQWRNALVVGTLMLGGGMGGTAYAEQTVGSGLVVAFIAVVPLMIALAEPGLRRGAAAAGRRGHRRRPGRRADADAGRRLPGLAGRAGAIAIACVTLVGRQRAEPAQPAAGAGRDGLRAARCCAAARC